MSALASMQVACSASQSRAVRGHCHLRAGWAIHRARELRVRHASLCKATCSTLPFFPSNPKCRVIINLEIKAKSGVRAARARPAERRHGTSAGGGTLALRSLRRRKPPPRRCAGPLMVRPCSGPAGGAAAPRPRRSSRPTSKHLREKARARGLGVWTRRRRRRARTRAARAERKREAQDASSARRRGAPTS